MNILNLIKNKKPYPRPAPKPKSPLTLAKEKMKKKKAQERMKKVLKGGKSLPTSTARERAISKKSRGPAGKILGKSKTIHSPHTKKIRRK